MDGQASSPRPPAAHRGGGIRKVARVHGARLRVKESVQVLGWSDGGCAGADGAKGRRNSQGCTGARCTLRVKESVQVFARRLLAGRGSDSGAIGPGHTYRGHGAAGGQPFSLTCGKRPGRDRASHARSGATITHPAGDPASEVGFRKDCNRLGRMVSQI